jgi:hypothetical protein
MDYAEVPRYLNLADLVVTPSETEGLSRVYLETQACGRVLIASDIPAAREVVEPGHTGLLFPRGDPAALAAAILRAGRRSAERAPPCPLDEGGRTHGLAVDVDGACAALGEAAPDARPGQPEGAPLDAEERRVRVGDVGGVRRPVHLGGQPGHGHLLAPVQNVFGVFVEVSG